MNAKSILSALSLVTLSWLAPSVGHACSCAADPLLHSIPADGDRGVPTNVAIWLEGYPDALALTAEDGTEVALETENLGSSGRPCGGNVWEARPKTPLAANTRYTLTATSDYSTPPSSEISFETGAGPSKATAPETPTFELVAATSRNWGGGTCGGRTQLCVRTALPDGTLGVLRMATEDYLESNAIYFDTPTHAATGSFGTSDCYSLWLRDAAGRRSEARTVCDVPTLNADERDITGYGDSLDCDATFAALGKQDDGPKGSGTDDAGVTNDRGVGERASSGCGAAPGNRPGNSSLLWLALLALAPRARPRWAR